MSNSITFPSLGGTVLRRGDNDNARIAGGRPHAGGSRPVEALQRALAAAGTYGEGFDGDFGDLTEEAVRRFAWFATHGGHRLQTAGGAAVASGAFGPCPDFRTTAAAGQCDAALATTLENWQSGGHRTSSRLVRVPLSRFKRIRRSGTFKTLTYPFAAEGEILANANFMQGLDAMDGIADRLGIGLRLNQSFRVEGIPPKGVVVPPASRSQHLIGHAVDLNMVVDSQTVTSRQMLDNETPKKGREFIAEARRAGLRWGGDFSTRDPVHFDIRVPDNEIAYDMNFFFCQRCFALGHPMRLDG